MSEEYDRANAIEEREESVPTSLSGGPFQKGKDCGTAQFITTKMLSS